MNCMNTDPGININATWKTILHTSKELEKNGTSTDRGCPKAPLAGSTTINALIAPSLATDQHPGA